MPRSGIPARPSNAAPRLVVVHPSTDRPRSAPSAERATTWPSGVAKVRPPLHPSAPIEQCPCCCSPCWPTGRPVHVARAPVRSFALAPDPPARCVHPHSAQSAAASGLASGPPRLTRWPILTGEPHRPVVLRLPVLGRQVIELPDLPVKCPRRNEAAKRAHASGCRAGGVPQLGLWVGRCRHD